MMDNRQDFEMTEADLAELLEATKPVPLIMLQCGKIYSPQEMANSAWAALGDRMGFEHMSVRPSMKGNRFFSAIPKIKDGA